MNTNLIISILTIAIVGLILTSNANASVSCGLNPKFLEDEKKFGEFLVEEAKDMEDSARVLKVGEKLKFSAENSTNPELKKLANEGVLTNDPVSFKNFRKQNPGYGSLVAISPCHAITNLHVAESLEATKQCEKFKGQSYFRTCYIESYENLKAQNLNLVGKNYIGSFPRSCGASVEARNYQVVAHAAQNKIKFENTTIIPAESDFVILKTSQSLNSERKYPRLDSGIAVARQFLISQGEGFDSLDSDELNYTRLTISSATKSNGKSAILVGANSTPGKSGSGVYSIYDGELKLAGFFVNGKNAFVAWQAVEEFLRQTNPALLSEIQKANREGVCQ